MLGHVRLALSERLLQDGVGRNGNCRGCRNAGLIFLPIIVLSGLGLVMRWSPVLLRTRGGAVAAEETPAINMAGQLHAATSGRRQLQPARGCQLPQSARTLRTFAQSRYMMPKVGARSASAAETAAEAEAAEATTATHGASAYAYSALEGAEPLQKVEGEASHLGLHIVAEFFLADVDALNNAEELEGAMRGAAEHGGATILSSHAHRFEPHGVSSVVIIQESNLCIHTWPEFGYAAADFFTCGDTVDTWKMFEYLKKFLKAQKFDCMELKRGPTNLINNPKLLIDRVDRIDHPRQLFLSEKEIHTDTEFKTGIIGEPLVDTRSKFQKVTIAKNKWWGNVLFIDDCMNVAARDEFIYHEMIAHVPMMIHPDPRRVLIIGGGDGGSAREVLRHPNLERVVMVDIDATVVENCKKYMPEVSQGAFDNPKLELIIGDGIDFVRKAASQSFDVIIVDSTDPNPDAAGEVLFTKDFYANVYRILSPNGVVSTQSMMPMRFEPRLYNNSLANLRESFSVEKTWIYLTPADSYNGQQSFGLGFKDGVHPEQIDKARIKTFSRANKLKYYNHNIHISSFCLPTYLKESLGLVEREEVSA